MSGVPTLYDASGKRKYLNLEERDSFKKATEEFPRDIRTFCLTLLYTGCRISEALAVTGKSIDFKEKVIIFESLKKRRKGVYRVVPVPDSFLELIDVAFDFNRLSDPPP